LNTARDKKYELKMARYCALMMEAVSTSEISVNFYETTRRNIPQDINLKSLKRYKPFTVISDYKKAFEGVPRS
jgi:hypothetical protein